jgi:RNA polymerase sigma-70 factor (ECF subfamily)
MDTATLNYIGNIARRIRRSSTLGFDWEDLAQEVAVHAWRHEQQRKTDHLGAWLYAIARQKSIQRWRRETTRGFEVNAPCAVPVDYAQPVDALIASETKQQAMQAIAQMPGHYVQVLAMRMQGVHDRKAARVLRTSTAAVRKVVNRARRKIERAIR